MRNNTSAVVHSSQFSARFQGISRLWWRKQQKPSRTKMTIFCFPDEVSCIWFYAFVFSRFEFFRELSDREENIQTDRFHGNGPYCKIPTEE